MTASAASARLSDVNNNQKDDEERRRRKKRLARIYAAKRLAYDYNYYSLLILITKKKININ